VVTVFVWGFGLGVGEVLLRVVGVLDVLELALGDVQVLVEELKGFMDGLRHYVTVDVVRNAIPKGVLKSLTFEDVGEYVVVRFKRLVKPEDFRAVAETVKGLGGEYVSLGKAGYFRVPKRRIVI